jgi:hypothetical protein
MQSKSLRLLGLSANGWLYESQFTALENHFVPTNASLFALVSLEKHFRFHLQRFYVFCVSHLDFPSSPCLLLLVRLGDRGDCSYGKNPNGLADVNALIVPLTSDFSFCSSFPLPPLHCEYEHMTKP